MTQRSKTRNAQLQSQLAQSQLEPEVTEPRNEQRNEQQKASSKMTQQMALVRDHLRNPKGQLAKLLAQTDKLQHVNRVFRAYLPNHLHEHAMITTMSAKVWVVQTDSSAWATRLRYVLPNLQQQLSDHLKKPVPPLTIRIKPGNTVEAAVEPRRMALTEKTAKLLEGTARDLNDQRLGSALLRLSRHVASATK